MVPQSNPISERVFAANSSKRYAALSLVDMGTFCRTNDLTFSSKDAICWVLCTLDDPYGQIRDES